MTARLAAALRLAAVLGAAALPRVSGAALSDEIQVYDDAIDAPGGRGLELHVNTTPRGRRTPDFPREFVPQGTWRITPEFSWGLTRTLEAGLYLPLLVQPGDGAHFAGPKLRMKWLPGQTDGGAGAFWGLNLELSSVGSRFEASRYGMELRPILGWRDPDWLLVVNPVLGWDLSAGQRGGGPFFGPAVKATHAVGERVSLGGEYDADLGRLQRFESRAAQGHTLYAVADVDLGGWAFNVGVGRGLNAATDRWTVKAILELPFH
jgi:hypothetical protein